MVNRVFNSCQSTPTVFQDMVPPTLTKVESTRTLADIQTESLYLFLNNKNSSSNITTFPLVFINVAVLTERYFNENIDVISISKYVIETLPSLRKTVEFMALIPLTIEAQKKRRKQIVH